MGKSDNGPDMQDCNLMMVALGELHGVNVSLVVQPDGGSGTASLELVAIATQRDGTKAAPLRSVSRKHHWPNVDSKTFEGAVYKLLHELDRDCSMFWRQAELFS